MYKRLSNRTAVRLHEVFNARLEKKVQLICKNMPVQKYKKVRASLKNLIIAYKRKQISIAVAELSLLALCGVKKIRKRIDQVNKTVHVKNKGRSHYTDITILSKGLRKNFKRAAGHRVDAPSALKFFGGDDRVYFKFDKSIEKITSQTQEDVAKFLKRKQYKILNYNEGYATDVKGKQLFGLGRLIKEDYFLSEEYALDPVRSLKFDRFKSLRVVISRRLEDIERMSVGRSWVSCTSIKGSKVSSTAHDIEKGSLIAYLVTAKDPDVLNPLSRILIKPYVDTQNKENILFVPVETYGVQNSIFSKVVNDIVDKEINGSQIKGIFRLAEDVYEGEDTKKTMFRGSGIFRDINNDKHYLKDGVHHREDGPALERNNGGIEYYLHGEELMKSFFDNRIEEQKNAQGKVSVALCSSAA